MTKLSSFEFGFFSELNKLAAVYKPKTLNEPVRLVSYKGDLDSINNLMHHKAREYQRATGKTSFGAQLHHVLSDPEVQGKLKVRRSGFAGLITGLKRAFGYKPADTKGYENIKEEVRNLPSWRKDRIMPNLEVPPGVEVTHDHLPEILGKAMAERLDDGATGITSTGTGLGVINLSPGARGLENWRNVAHHEAVHGSGVPNELVAYIAGRAAVPRGVGFYHPKRLLGGLKGAGSWLMARPIGYKDYDIFGNAKGSLDPGQSGLSEFIKQWKLYTSGGNKAPR